MTDLSDIYRLAVGEMTPAEVAHCQPFLRRKSPSGAIRWSASMDDCFTLSGSIWRAEPPEQSHDEGTSE
jgi:hypothetical protein